MSEQTNISWCDSTINFWSGCTKVSSGCTNCYAEVQSNRFLRRNTNGELLEPKRWGKGQPRMLHESAFKLAEKLNRKPWVCDECGYAFGGSPAWCPRCEDMERNPNAKLHRRRVFSLSLGDINDPEVDIEWTSRAWDHIRRCDNLHWIICSKRWELWRERMDAVLQFAKEARNEQLCHWVRCWDNGRTEDGFSIPKHVTILASVENQPEADRRIPEFLKIPAARRGLSCEPLLGPVEFSDVTHRSDGVLRLGRNALHGISWVIVGAEQKMPGHKILRLPHNSEEGFWAEARNIMLQCNAAGVPFFMKQGPVNGRISGDPSEWPEDLRVQQFPT